jgi:hypothetical protein
MSIECPTCKAPPGKHCRRPSGHNCSMHAGRWMKAERPTLFEEAK